MGMPGKSFVTELQSLPTKVFKALYVKLAGETQLAGGNNWILNGVLAEGSTSLHNG